MEPKAGMQEMISAETISKRVTELAREIEKDYFGKQMLTVSILKGSVIFTADLVRELDLELEMAFMSVSSYANSTVSKGSINIRSDVDIPVGGRDVLVIEDIIDTGLTLAFLKKHLEAKGAASVKFCTMFDKPSRRKVEIVPDYCGFTIEDYFIVGYGLDAGSRYRNLKGAYKLIQ